MGLKFKSTSYLGNMIKLNAVAVYGISITPIVYTSIKESQLFLFASKPNSHCYISIILYFNKLYNNLLNFVEYFSIYD